MSEKNGKKNGEKKERKSTPFLARLNKQLDLLEKKAGVAGKALLRAGKADISTVIVETIAGARSAIADLAADFKPAGGGSARALTVGSKVEIVPSKRADFSVMGEAIAAGLFEVISIGERNLGAKSLVNSAVTSFFKKGDLQLPGTPPRKPRAKNGEGKKASGKKEARA